MKTREIMIGCGFGAFVTLILSTVVVYFWGAAIFKFGIGSDLSDYRYTLQRMDFDLSDYRYTLRGMSIDAKIGDQLIDDFEDVRLSLDKGNNFDIFQWFETDDSIQGILADGKIDAGEYDSLRTDIALMKKIQGIIDGKGKVKPASVFTTRDSNVYHKRDCSKLDATKGLAEFTTSQQARNFGGVPCNNCNQ